MTMVEGYLDIQYSNFFTKFLKNLMAFLILKIATNKIYRLFEATLSIFSLSWGTFSASCRQGFRVILRLMGASRQYLKLDLYRSQT